MMQTETTIVPMPEEASGKSPTRNLYSLRMRTLRDWVYKNCCEGRTYKEPVFNNRGMRQDTAVKWSPVRCFGGSYYPIKANDPKEEFSIAPSILVSCVGYDPASETMQYMDNRQDVHRPKEMASAMTCQLIHCLYEPGERTGRTTKTQGTDIHEALETDDIMDIGSMVLGAWMDDTMAQLLAPGALSELGMQIKETSVHAQPLVENGSVSDRRPYYLGVVSFVVVGQTRRIQNPRLKALLE